MILQEDYGLKIAEFLLQIKAVRLQPNNPFSWASGWKSPIYCDNRKTLSFPSIRTFIRQKFVELIEQEYGKPEVIAGVATGGIAMGALVAQELGIPFVYVRSSSKAHGLHNQVEGVINAQQSVVVIEDLISSGKSSLNAVHALKEQGANVKGVIAIFSYGFETAIDLFKKANCKINALTNYTTLIRQALATGYINEKDIETLENWRKDPAGWKQP